MRRGALGVMAVLLVAVAGLWVSSPIDPAPWDPPPEVPLSGPYGPDTRLAAVEWWARQLVGPEAVTLTPEGTLMVGLRDGRVVELSVGSDEPRLIVDTSGRPLAVARHPDGRLIICDAHRGLLAFGPAGLEVLATEEGGIPFRFVDDLAIDSGGTIFFTDASARHSIEQFTDDLIEHRTTGRVLKYDVGTRQVTRLAGDFSFANGVALDPEEQSVIVSETGAYRLWRIWVAGPRAGSRELFTDSLPGFPDNVRPSPSRGGYWVAIGSPRKPEMDALAHLPTLRKLVGGLPRSLQPAPVRHGWVLRVDATGAPVESFQDPSPASYSPIASATEGADGYLYLGSFSREGVARLKLPSSGARE